MSMSPPLPEEMSAECSQEIQDIWNSFETHRVFALDDLLYNPAGRQANR